MSVSPVYVFDLAAQHARGATVRQAVITGNIANANTSGYTAQDITPFSAVLDDAASVSMARTNPGHIDISDSSGADNAATWEVKDSGGPGKLDTELINADDTSRSLVLHT